MSDNPIKIRKYEEALKRAVIKEVNGKKHSLLKASWKDSYYQSFVNIIDYSFLQHCNLPEINFSLSFLNNDFSNHKVVGRFFHIFYNEVFKTNQAVWKFEEREFSSFKKYLIYRILAGVCAKNKKKSVLKNVNHNLISEADISKIISDKEALKLIASLQSNKSEFYSLFSPPPNFVQEEGWDSFLQYRINQVKELFILLRESNQILLRYILSTDPLFNYIPKKLAQNDDDELFKSFGVFENNVRALVSFVLIRNQGNYFMHDNIAENSQVSCFAERAGVFYKVVAIRNERRDVALNPTYPNGIEVDYKSTEEPRFMYCVWLLKDMKEKLYFPDCGIREVRNAAIDILDSYLKRDVIVHNHNTGKEENINDATLYLCKESFLEFKNDELRSQIKENYKNKDFVKAAETMALAINSGCEDNFSNGVHNIAEDSKPKKNNRTLTRLIDAIIKSYGKAGKKEINWDTIVRVIEKSTKNKEGKVTVLLDNAGKYVFGLLNISDDKLIITWKGNSKKSKTTKELSYSREQFFDNHKKILKRNDIIS